MAPGGSRRVCQRIGRGAFCACLLALAARVQAQSLDSEAEVAQVFNWYYATAFGTGTYSIGDDRIFVARFPLSWSLGGSPDRPYHLELKVPITLGLTRLGEVDDLDDLDETRIGSIGVVPGLELEVALDPRWTVRPFANLGAGWESETETPALIYQAGVKTTYAVPDTGVTELTLGGRLVFAGYKVKDSSRERVFAMSLGAEALWPSPWQLGGRPLRLGTHLIATTWFSSLELFVPGSGERSLSSEYAIGLVAAVERPLSLLGIELDRIGISYVTASDGLTGIRLIGSFPF